MRSLSSNLILRLTNLTKSSTSPPSPPSPAMKSSPSLAAVAASLDDDDDDDDGDVQFGQKTMMTWPSVLQPRVLVYDGVSRFCHSGVKWIIRADKHEKIKFCCLQSSIAEPYMNLCGVEREDVLHKFLFVEGLGHYYQGSTALLKVLSYLPFPYSALSSFSIIPTSLRDAVYDYTAEQSYKWGGKGEKLLVLQDPEMLERFIDREEILERYQSDI